MSVDTVFKPLGATFQVTTATVQRLEAGNPGPVTFRVKCLVASYLTWGPKSTVTAAGAPAAGTPVVNTIGMATVGGVMYIEVPPDSFFISSVASAFELTPGTGGSGGAA